MGVLEAPVLRSTHSSILEPDRHREPPPWQTTFPPTTTGLVSRNATTAALRGTGRLRVLSLPEQRQRKSRDDPQAKPNAVEQQLT